MYVYLSDISKSKVSRIIAFRIFTVLHYKTLDAVSVIVDEQRWMIDVNIYFFLSLFSEFNKSLNLFEANYCFQKEIYIYI